MGTKHYNSRRSMGVFIAYFLIYVVWGSTYYFIGVALRDFPVFLLGALRFSAAGLILLVICHFRGEKIIQRSLILKSAISGIVLLFVDMAVVMMAQRYISSSLVAIIASSTAVWILLFDVPMWRYNLRQPMVALGILLGFAGVILLYLEQLQTTTSHNNQYGILLLVGGCISWALGSLYTRYRSFSDKRHDSFSGSAWQMVFASSIFWVCSFSRNELSGVNFGLIDITSWLSLVYLVSFGSLLAYSAYIWLLKVRPVSEVATHAYVNPVIAIILGVFLGGEQVSFIQLVGLFIILLGVVLIGRRGID